MRKYEYDSLLSQEHREQPVLGQLNEMAAQGWRVVGIMRNTYILEREVLPETLFKGMPLAELNEEEREEYRRAILLFELPPPFLKPISENN